MKDLVFYCYSEKSINYILKLALSIADNYKTNISIVLQNPNSIVLDYSSKLKVYDLKNFSYEEFEKAIFITPFDDLLYFVIHAQNYPHIQVFCLFYYPQIVNSFFNQFTIKKADKTDLIHLIESTSSYGLENRNCYLYAKSAAFNLNEIYLPELLEKKYYVKKLEFKKLEEDKVNIAWYGTVTEYTFYPLQNLLNNILNSPIQQKVDLHILGNGNHRWKINFEKYSSKIRFIFFPPTNDEEDTLNYIKKNIDLVVTYGISVLKASSLGVPTVITSLSTRKYADDRYVFSFESYPGLFNWGNTELWNLQLKCHTIADVIDKIIEDKKMIGQKCYDFCWNHHAEKQVADAFLDAVNQTRLSVSSCLKNDLIGAQIALYDEQVKSKKVESYSEFYQIYAERKKMMSYKFLKRVYYKALYLKRELKQYLKKNFPWLVHIKRRINSIKFYRIYRKYPNKVIRIQNRLAAEKKVKVAFILVFNTVFPVRPVFEEMLGHEVFDPYIIVAPNISRTHQYQMEVYKEAVTALSEQYPGRVIEGYDEEEDRYFELKDDFSIIFFCNPYPKLVHKFHSIDYFMNKDVLTIYANYGFAALKFWDEVINTKFYNQLWKACVETKSNLEYLKKHQALRGKNAIVSGYLKMDRLAKVVSAPRERKRIIISPHHTVWGWSTLNIGNFLKYHEFFLELPRLYPQIDFVFRPHPLLFSNLISHKIWSQEQIDEYILKIESYQNATYDKSGSYFEQFGNSDAMIHDCGSFIGEYLYTEKPCCYMLKSLDQVDSNLLPLGQACMENYYKAFCQEDIQNFIENVVIKGIDPLKQKREDFVRKELKVNYPYAAKELIKMLEKELAVDR